MKFFLLYTSIIEAITGIALILIPSTIILLLLETKLSGNGEIILAMLAGAAILSLAVSCWVFNRSSTAVALAKLLLFYNLSIMAIFLYGMLGFGIRNAGMWIVVCFHTFQTVIGIIVLSNNKESG